jgi:hypothetical protein
MTRPQIILYTLWLAAGVVLGTTSYSAYKSLTEVDVLGCCYIPNQAFG